MSFAIVFNTAWNQPDSARENLRSMTGNVVEINADQPAPDRGRTQVIVAGKQVPRDRSTAAEPLSEVQRGLRALGYLTGDADGIDGELTRKAVRQYQASTGLEPDGKITPELLERIRYTRQVVAATRFKPISERPAADRQVVLVQTGLAELGYRPGSIDGFVGDGTRRAIREFEADRGLPQTGEVSVRLITELRKVAGVSKLIDP